jgi:hypothetical protein
MSTTAVEVAAPASQPQGRFDPYRLSPEHVADAPRTWDASCAASGPGWCYRRRSSARAS